MKISQLLLSTTLLTLPLSANATEKYYFSLTGEYMPSATADGDVISSVGNAPLSLDFKNGYGAIGAIGYYITPEVRGELEGAYRHLEGKSATVTIAGNPYTIDASKTEAEALSAMGNLYYDIPTGTNLTPYIGGGIGWAHQINNGTSNAFAYQAMLGLNYKLSASNTIFGGYRYLGTTDFNNKYSVSGVDINEKVNLSASSIDIGYRYSF